MAADLRTPDLGEDGSPKAAANRTGHRMAIAGGVLAMCVAAAGWVWLSQPQAPSPLPSSTPVAASEPPAPVPARPHAAITVAPPPSAAVADVGDTRPYRP
jgi:hypothetical protein